MTFTTIILLVLFGLVAGAVFRHVFNAPRFLAILMTVGLGAAFLTWPVVGQPGQVKEYLFKLLIICFFSLISTYDFRRKIAGEVAREEAETSYTEALELCKCCNKRRDEHALKSDFESEACPDLHDWCCSDCNKHCCRR
ncbi:MAG TPA: hypothetical protein VEA59_07380 [Patescibacteria group bacterium]|nr:hypothetical protein [Patescibacteria group bacterium]